jgi:hypothetical protein
MDASEPRVRHRGFFLHSDTTGEPDTGEHETPEGLGARVRVPRRTTNLRGMTSSRGSSRSRLLSGRSGLSPHTDDSLPEIRSGSVTGSRQRAHMPR